MKRILFCVKLLFRWRKLEWKERTEFKNAINLWKKIFLKKKVFLLFNTPFYGNLGDQAIAIAEKSFFALKFPDYELIELPGHLERTYLEKIAFFLPPYVKVIVTGGGYMGSLWRDEEEYVRLLVKKFKRNRIIVMPQTVYYEETDTSREYLKQGEKIYNEHRNLLIVARERRTLNFLKENFPFVKSVLCPDMVAWIKKPVESVRENKVVLCFRSDKEKVFNKKIVAEIKDHIKTELPEVMFLELDTVIKDAYIDVANRQSYVNDILKEFSQARLIVTDRLHGMLFAAITSTPCIVFDNKTGKISQSYEFIKHNAYITYTDELQFNKVLNKINLFKEYHYSNTGIMRYYEELAKELRK